MATSQIPVPNLFAPVQAFVAWLAGGSTFRSERMAAPAPHVRPPLQPAALATGPAARPLRVVRVLEPSASRSTAGRMVISGRLADVCAELDRLAALEAPGR